ncbi:radical SAM protein [Clostridium sp. 'deep sea']|uniref:radical SAM/SPASM domain-containing protein n=1 Tax=Clostridium sp. 'deep sea' TaxID=2779445 RepID=UPI0018966D33|nr:radical SAM protein [Clostridium sp. 'deep sea']QOR33931.1 radical SAM protein [Clostridium sp. 'deep sea']
MFEKNQNKYITVIAKVTNDCNLQCPYCYNRDKNIKDNVTVMSLEILEKIIYNVARYYEGGSIVLHGGEPLLVGVEWIKELGQLLRVYNSSYRCNIEAAIQTNATLLSEEILEVANTYGISFGFSFDGLTNELTRGSTKKILKNMQLTRKSSGSLGCICLVSKNNYQQLIKEFEYFNMLNINVQFAPMFKTKHMDKDLYDDMNINQYINYMCELFNHYITKMDCRSSITNFDRLIKLAIGQKKGMVCNNMICNYKWISVDPRGNYYPCGRDWTEEYQMGNINELTFQEAFLSTSYENYVNQVSKKLTRCRDEIKCNLFHICHGACPATALSDNGDVASHATRDCTIFKKTFTHVYNYINNTNKPILNPIVKKLLNRR